MDQLQTKRKASVVDLTTDSNYSLKAYQVFLNPMKEARILDPITIVKMRTTIKKILGQKEEGVTVGDINPRDPKDQIAHRILIVASR